jgi:sec-independent protein translocase protein TatA
MFGSIGPTELILIFVIALLVFGPKKLPEVGKSVGKAIREFKKASDEIKERIEEEIQASEIKDIHKDIQAGMKGLESGVKNFKDEIKKEIPTTPLTDLRKDLQSIADATHPVKALKEEVKKGFTTGLQPQPAPAEVGPAASMDTARPDIVSPASVDDPYAARAETTSKPNQAGGSGAPDGAAAVRPEDGNPPLRESDPAAAEPLPPMKPKARKRAVKPQASGAASETAAGPEPGSRPKAKARRRAGATRAGKADTPQEPETHESGEGQKIS